MTFFLPIFYIILLELFVFFINWVVSQVHKSVIFVFFLNFFERDGGEASQTILIKKNLERVQTFYQHIESAIEFKSI